MFIAPVNRIQLHWVLAGLHDVLNKLDRITTNPQCPKHLRGMRLLVAPLKRLAMPTYRRRSK
jgi:hypothetical protein